MKRFNLLLVTQDMRVRPAVLKALSKTFKSNFVFEVAHIDEAFQLLKKLHIDILMLDFEDDNFDFVALSNRFPSLRIMGLTSNLSRNTANIDIHRHQIFEKRDLELSLSAEFKQQRKSFTEPQASAVRQQNQAPAADFKDFGLLAKTMKS